MMETEPGIRREEVLYRSTMTAQGTSFSTTFLSELRQGNSEFLYWPKLLPRYYTGPLFFGVYRSACNIVVSSVIVL